MTPCRSSVLLLCILYVISVYIIGLLKYEKLYFILVNSYDAGEGIKRRPRNHFLIGP